MIARRQAHHAMIYFNNSGCDNRKGQLKDYNPTCDGNHSSGSATRNTMEVTKVFEIKHQERYKNR
eukprot:scaffold6757_cov38-Prasinocladus_malaysianus.AAC.1